MSRYSAESSPLEIGRQVAQEADLIQAHAPILTTMGKIVQETGLACLPPDTQVRIQQFETPTHTIYSASFPDLHLLGDEVVDFCHQARGDFFSRDSYYPYRQTVRGIISHWEEFEQVPRSSPLYQIHERLVGKDHMDTFMDRELPLLHESVTAAFTYDALMSSVNRVISRQFVETNLPAVTDRLQQNLPWYYLKLGGILYAIARWGKPELTNLRHAIASVAQQFPTIDSDDRLWRGANSDKEAEERMAQFAKQTIERIASDPTLVDDLFKETKDYNNGPFFTDSREIYPVDETSQQYIIEEEEFWHAGMKYLGDGLVLVEFQGSQALVKLNNMDNIVVSENVRKPSGISPWLLWAEDKHTGEMSLYLGDVQAAIKDGVSLRASRSLGVLLSAVMLPDDVRMQLVPPEVANRETEDFFVPLIAQTHALQIIQHSPFAQAVKALALSAA